MAIASAAHAACNTRLPCSIHRKQCGAPSCRQVDILQHLGASLNVAFCYGAYEQPQCVGVVMELLSGGELWSRIRKGHYSEAGELRSGLSMYPMTTTSTDAPCLRDA